MRKIFVILLFLVVGFANAQSTTFSYRFYNGVTLYLLGDRDSAVHIFAANIVQNPSHAPSYYYLAKIAYEKQDAKTALDYINRAISFDPDPDYMLLQGQLYISMNDYPAAQKVFGDLSVSGEPQFYVMNAALLFETGQLDKAFEACNEYEAKYGYDERLADVKRLIYFRNGKYFDAEQYLKSVIEVFPLSQHLLVARAEINVAMRQDSVAVKLYKQAIEIDSTSVEAHMAYIRYLEYRNNVPAYLNALLPIFRLDEVSADMKAEIFESTFFTSEIYRDNFSAIRRIASAMLISEADNLKIRMLYGRYLTYTGQIDQALEHYTAIFEQGLLSEDLCERVAEIHLYQKNFGKADTVLARSVAAYPLNANLAQAQVIATWLGGNAAGAVKLAQSSLKRLPKSDSVSSLFYAIQGDIYHEMGEAKKCYSAYDKALRYEPDNALVLNNYAYFLSLEGRQLERALVMATRANEISAANPTYLDTKAWVLFTMGNYAQAQNVQRAALGLDTTGAPEYLLHYGDILYALGDDFLARTYWKKALDAGADKATIDQRMARPKPLNNR